MNVAYVHHHLRPGGVTRVILDEIESLGGKVNALIITGERPSIPLSSPWALIPSIAYDAESGEKAVTEAVAGSISAAARMAWRDEPCVFHVHNPTLGKNRALAGALKILHERSERLLLHIHDFAEDGRPDLYSTEEYPSDCHYAVINRRDYGILRRAGLGEGGLHYLPDAVRPLEAPGPRGNSGASGPGRGLVLYPVRAIRRKNIGEAVLLSLFIPEGQTVGVTLEPTGALDRRSCGDWKDFVRDEGLPVLFGLGNERGLDAVLGETTSMITTSVKEGFGLTYLEPWTARRMLFGRKLDICSDFTDRGLRLDHLYGCLRIPFDLFSLDAFERKWRKCYAERLERYGMAGDEERVEDFFHDLNEEGCVDFGCLSEDLQRDVLRRLAREAKSRSKLVERNPFLSGMFAPSDAGSIVETNRRIVLREFSSENTGIRLREVYETVLRRQVRHKIDKREVVRAFNSPIHNNLLLCPSAYE
jgi:hypothetical protein